MAEFEVSGLEDPPGGERVDLSGLRSRSLSHPPASDLFPDLLDLVGAGATEQAQ